ncbi:MAG: ZinT family metal-binding protein [Jeotgalicoccus sp.]
MKKKLFEGLSVIALVGLLAACQNGETEKEAHEVHNHEEHESESHGHEETGSAVIDGLSDHYHTGDNAELTVSSEVESDGHWHWYTSEDGKEWAAIDGEYEDTLSIKAADGQYIKALLYDSDHNIAAESESIEITVDDHTGDIYNGYFDDEQIADRDISDWSGKWQSVYSYLESGEIDKVFEHKSEDGDMTAEEYKEYYREGYMTDVNKINITDSGEFTFYKNDEEYSGQYDYDGYEVLEYEAGNRGVRFIFVKTAGDEEAPQYIQFSDHIIAPEKSGHYHLYWGDDREELLSEVEHWPTYYPDDLTVDDIKKDMLQH